MGFAQGRLILLKERVLLTHRMGLAKVLLLERVKYHVRKTHLNVK